MNQTFHFVKVAAGEPFPFETGEYKYNFTGSISDNIYSYKSEKGDMHSMDRYVIQEVLSQQISQEEVPEIATKCINFSIWTQMTGWNYVKYSNDWVGAHGSLSHDGLWEEFSGSFFPSRIKDFSELDVRTAIDLCLKDINNGRVINSGRIINSLRNQSYFPSPIQVTREQAEAWAKNQFKGYDPMHQRIVKNVTKDLLDYLQSSQPQPSKTQKYLDFFNKIKDMSPEELEAEKAAIWERIKSYR